MPNYSAAEGIFNCKGCVCVIHLETDECMKKPCIMNFNNFHTRLKLYLFIY